MGRTQAGDTGYRVPINYFQRCRLRSLYARGASAAADAEVCVCGEGAGVGGAGPEFVPMNGICRSFPASIVELLRGDGTTGDNKLCTTLFCISSALKKLSQTTPLPASRSAAPEVIWSSKS